MLSDTFNVFFTNRAWLSDTKLKNINYRIVVFKPKLLSGKISKDPQTQEAAKLGRQLTFARFYLPVFLPEAEKAIYLDDDIIVQGKRINKEIKLMKSIFQLLVVHYFHSLTLKILNGTTGARPIEPFTDTLVSVFKFANLKTFVLQNKRCSSILFLFQVVNIWLYFCSSV